MIISEMIVGERYLVGDSWGYDTITCLGQPTEEEVMKYFGYMPAGSLMKVQYENGSTDIFFESPAWEGHIYVEPR